MKNQLNKFKKFLRSQNKSDNTINAYINDVKSITLFFDAKSITDLSNFKIQEFFDSKDYSDSTISRKLNSLNAFFEYCIDSNLLEDNPINKIQYPEKLKDEILFLQTSEISLVRSYLVNDFELYKLFEFFLQTGLKIGELNSLNKEQIYENDQSLSLRLKKRKLKLNNKAKLVIKSQLQNDYSNLLFSNSRNKPIGVRNIRKKINKIFNETNLNNFTVNDIRNTFIINQLKFGVNPKFLNKYIGNKSYASIQRYFEFCDCDIEGNEINGIFEI